MNSRDRLLKKNNLVGMEIDTIITKEKPYNEETAILRKTLYAVIHGLPIPEEFETYYARAEAVKAEVKARTN